LNRKTLWVTVIAVLVSLFLVPVVYWEIEQNQNDMPQPLQVYLSNSWNYDKYNQTYMEIWNKTRDLDEISRFSRYGNYSVLITLHAYACGGDWFAEWFVAVSTLQPDNDGFIHQILLRLNDGNLTVVKSYQESHNLNLTSVEDGKSMAGDSIGKGLDWLSMRNTKYVVYYPFLLVFLSPCDLGATVIVNLNTSRIVVAAFGVWMGHGYLIYPERTAKMGE